MSKAAAALQALMDIPRIDAQDGCGASQGAVDCFTAEALVLTDTGQVRVADLDVGDLVLTRDRNLQPVRAIHKRRFPNGAPTKAAPVLIKKGVLGQGNPRSDVMLSPGHMVLVNGALAQRFGYNEVLVPAGRLAGAVDGVSVRRNQASVEYFHIVFDRSELIMCDGFWSECFRDTRQMRAGISAENRTEIMQFFPELEESFRHSNDDTAEVDLAASLDWAQVIGSNIRAVLDSPKI